MRSNLLVYIFCICFSGSILSQTESFHTINFDKKPEWISINKQIHTIIYYDNGIIASRNYLKEKNNWEHSLPDFKGAKFYNPQNSKFLRISKGKSLSLSGKNDKVVIIDKITGEIVFNTDDIAEFEKNKIYYTADDKYALLYEREKIKGDKKKNIKKKINKYITLVKIGEHTSRWKIKLPEEASGKGIKKDFWSGFVGNDDTVVFSLGNTLYAFNTNDGTVGWKKSIVTENINSLHVSSFGYRDKGFLLTYKERGQPLKIDFVDFDTCTSIWQKPVELGNYYKLKYLPSTIFVECEYGINYLEYNGEMKWANFIKPTSRPSKVYKQDSGYLITQQYKDYWAFEWANSKQQILQEEPLKMYSNTINKGIKVDDYLILITPNAIQTYDLSKGEPLVVEAYDKKHFKYSIDKVNKKIIYTNDKKEIREIVLGEKESRTFLKEIPFKGKKDSIYRIEAFPDKYVFKSKQELIQFDLQKIQLKSLYYKPNNSAGLLKKGAVIGTLILGTVFNDEVRQGNSALYSEGIKDIGDLENDLTAVALFGDAGMGIIAADGLGRVFNEFDYNTNSKEYTNLNQYWFYRDKIDKSWGLRLVDLDKVEEVNQFLIGNSKEFTFQIDQTAKILIASTKNEVKFFQL